MDHYNKGKKFGGGGGRKFGGGGDRGGRGGDRGGRGGFGGGRDGDRQMHRAVCDDCGKNCEVPFRPTGEKPIFCSDCFSNKRDSGSRDSRDRGHGGRDSKPRFDKKSYQGGGHDAPNYKAQFDMLNSKMDRILKALNINAFEEKIKDTKKEIIDDSKSKKFKKAPKSSADKTALKKAIKKTVAKKSTVKKKAVAKKPTTKKKAVAKKAPAKKTTKKKAVTKKK